MTQQRHAVLTFGILIACGAAVAMAVSPLAWIGYMFGVTTCLAAAVIAGADFD